MINIISCMDNNNVIGMNNKMPWHLPKDLAHFKKTTEGHIVVMGSKTYDSIGKDLPNRKNFVLTSRNMLFYELYPETFAIAGNSATLDFAIDKSWKDKEVFIIGGANVYEQFLPLADRLYITRVNAEFEGDTYFPEIDYSRWKPVESSIRKEIDGDYELHFVEYTRA